MRMRTRKNEEQGRDKALKIPDRVRLFTAGDDQICCAAVDGTVRLGGGPKVLN